MKSQTSLRITEFLVELPRQKFLNKVKQIIESKLSIASGDYRNEERFQEDLGCDSLDIVDLIMECERQFNISIPDDDVDKIRTVQDLIDYVKEHAK